MIGENYIEKSNTFYRNIRQILINNHILNLLPLNLMFFMLK